MNDKKKSKVALIRCDSYEYKDVKKAVEHGIKLIGGAGKFFKKGQKVLLKPNLLIADVPERCVTTHPAVFKAVGEIFLDAGADLSYGDSPSFGSMAATAKKAGIYEAAMELSIKEADFKNGEEIFFEKGKQNKTFIIAKGALENDVIISLPKLKTHGFQKMTGCVKNQFGCIPGVLKGEYHIKLPDVNKFGQMLVDLSSFIHPLLYIMDGIYAMEGNGPRGGKPRKMNILLFSNDPIAVDSVVCRLINVNPELVPTIKFGCEAGMGTYLENEIELLGDDIEGFKQPDFIVNRAPLKPYKESGFLRFLSNRLVPKPVVIKDKCIICGMCVNMCPTSPKSIDWSGGDKKIPPSHNYKTCIRCYCCQEVCPESAIVLKYPVLRKIFF